MKYIASFIIFLICLLTGNLPKRREQAGKAVEFPENKYDAVVGPNAELTPRFCPVCHRLVVYTRETASGKQIIRNGKVIVTIGGNFIVSKNGKTENGFPVSCPNGHQVRLN